MMQSTMLSRVLRCRLSRFPVIRRTLSSKIKRLEEKKVERLTQLRDAINEIYHSFPEPIQSGQLDWNQVRRELSERQIYFPSNFEFSLLSAFDPSMVPVDEIVPLNPDLFEAIADHVGQTKEVQENKIAAVRFCAFLGQYPQYLRPEHLEFIRRTAQVVAQDSVQIHPVVLDTAKALADSSPENCRLALELLPEFLRCREKNFALKISLTNLLVRALIKHGLHEECLNFLEKYTGLLQVDFETVTRLLQMFASVRITKSFTRENLMNVIRRLGDMHVPVMADDLPVLVDRILKQKLGYKNVQDVTVEPATGKCRCCGQTLPGMTVDEFRLLRSHFKSIIFDLNDHYMMDNLTEFQLQLMDFESKILIEDGQDLTKIPPKYDLVVDGLNVGYRRAKAIVHDKYGLRQFAKVYKIKDIDNQIVTIMETNHLMRRFQRIMLIGRQHMKSWFQLNRMCKKHRDRIDLQLLLNRTRDDNYILYSAVQHPDTMVLSNDYFRDHRFKFNQWYQESDEERPNLDRLFQRWLKSHQIKIQSPGFSLKFPIKSDIKIHVLEKPDASNPIVHIPVVLQEDPHYDDHEIGWICVQPDCST